MMQAVVIGSGLSGLTAGAKLAQEGAKVTVFEQFERPGGVNAVIPAAFRTAQDILVG